MSIQPVGGGVLSDTTMSAVELALDAVAAQQRQTSANIANASTPGYRAQRVEFAGDLARAIAAGNPSSAAITTQDANTPANVDGNTVALDVESKDLMTEGLHYQALVQAMSFKLNVLRTAITGQ